LVGEGGRYGRKLVEEEVKRVILEERNVRVKEDA
jgi:hypothetical protein